MQGLLNDRDLIYQQITKLIEDGILNGEYREEEQVPSTNELARVFNINPATAGKGINQLVDRGILYKKRGIGMFVATGATKLLKESRREEFKQTKLKELVREARQLMITEKELQQMIAEAMEEKGDGWL